MGIDPHLQGHACPLDLTFMAFGKNSTAVSVSLLLLSMTSIVSGASMAKHLFQDIGPESTSVIRLAVASFFLVAFWRPWRFQVTRAQAKLILIYGLSLGLMNFLFYMAIARLPIGLAIAIEFTGPLAVALWFSRKPVDFIWVFLALLGIVLILPLSDLQPTVDLVGVAFALAAAVMWAVYIVQGKKASAAAPPGVVTSYGMILGCLAVLPFGTANLPLVFSSSELFLSAVGVGILSSAIPYSLEMIVLDRLASKHFSLLMSLEPAIGATAGFFFLSESLSALQLLAIGCIIAASIGSTSTASAR